MASDMSPQAHQSAPGLSTPVSFPVGLWITLALSIASTALWIAWPALWGQKPLDVAQLIISSALVGVAGLLVITVVEMRVAPWRYLE